MEVPGYVMGIILELHTLQRIDCAPRRPRPGDGDTSPATRETDTLEIGSRYGLQSDSDATVGDGESGEGCKAGELKQSNQSCIQCKE